jgi:hypothetical protein
MNQQMPRRALLRTVGAGLGSVAPYDLLADDQARAASVPTPAPHFAARAKHNIVVFLPGGPAHIDLFDPKPARRRYAGQRPDAVTDLESSP